METKSTASSQTLELQAQQKQHLNLTQRLIMSAHMQQAIRLLQLPLMELESFIEEQVVSNPLLEISKETEEEDFHEKENFDEMPQESDEKELMISETDFSILKKLDEDFQNFFDQNEPHPVKRSLTEDKHKTYLESSISTELNLYQHLIQEAHESFEHPDELATAEVLIGYIDEFGFLTTPLHEIASLHKLDEHQIEKILKEIQTFEPYGIGASTTQESLLIQLRCLHKEHTLAYQIVENYYEELLYNRIPLIQKGLKCSFNEIQEAIEHDISKLDLHPGTHFCVRNNQALVPDVSLRQDGEQLVVDVNREYTPHLRLNNKYLKILEDPATSTETKNFIRRHIFSARWLMRNLQQRYSTVERIAASLVNRQKEFFTNPDGKLVPLTMKTLAEELQVHESTIARTVSNKYIYSPRGLMSLRDFFTSGYNSDQGGNLSSRTVREAISEIVETENKQHPLSDEKICALLKEKGMPCARRTVAKYRHELQIGNAQQRRKF